MINGKEVLARVAMVVSLGAGVAACAKPTEGQKPNEAAKAGAPATNAPDNAKPTYNPTVAAVETEAVNLVSTYVLVAETDSVVKIFTPDTVTATVASLAGLVSDVDGAGNLPILAKALAEKTGGEGVAGYLKIRNPKTGFVYEVLTESVEGQPGARHVAFTNLNTGKINYAEGQTSTTLENVGDERGVPVTHLTIQDVNGETKDLMTQWVDKSGVNKLLFEVPYVRRDLTDSLSTQLLTVGAGLVDMSKASAAELPTDVPRPTDVPPTSTVAPTATAVPTATEAPTAVPTEAATATPEAVVIPEFPVYGAYAGTLKSSDGSVAGYFMVARLGETNEYVDYMFFTARDGKKRTFATTFGFRVEEDGYSQTGNSSASKLTGVSIENDVLSGKLNWDGSYDFALTYRGKGRDAVIQAAIETKKLGLGGGLNARMTEKDVLTGALSLGKYGVELP